MTLLAETDQDRVVADGGPLGWWSRRPWAAPVLAVACVVAAALAYLAPALLHGTKLGTEDILGVSGLGAVPGTHPHNVVASDQVDEMMPWAALSWEQVRHGQLPLWNPYAGFGLPLMFGFVSASMSLPMLVSYLFPVSSVYTIEVVVKLLIAGTGVLWFCRKLGLSYLASVMAAVTFELSGSFTAWLGWPMSGTYAWLGWAAGAALMVVRGPRRVLYGAGLAVSLAFAAYAGHPETMVLLVLCVCVLAATAIVGLIVETGRLSTAVRPLLGLAASGIAAIGLSAPLLLPGLQVLGRANRSGVLGYPLPTRSAVNLLFGSYQGLPTTASRYFGTGSYYENAAYVGVVVAVLAGLALVRRWRDPTVIGLASIVLLSALFTYSTSMSHLLDTIPIVKNGQWTRSIGVLDFALAVLGGIGLEVLLRRGRETVTKWVFASLAAAAAIVVGVLWLRSRNSPLPAIEAHIRADSFVWPLIGVVVLLVASVALFLPQTHGRHAASPRGRISGRARAVGVTLVGAEVAFLLTATPGIWSSSTSFFPVTTAEATLQSEVGQARVGFADCPSILANPNLGILPEANSAYGVREASAYDGIVPKSYFTAYFRSIHERVPANTGFGQFCPSMSSAMLARHFGVAYVLGPAGGITPAGMVPVTTIGDELLYRVPGAGVITTEPDGAPPDSATATPVPVGGSDPSSMHLNVSDTGPTTLFVHVTDFPGWHATVDGKPLLLHAWGGTMLAASLPAGRHAIVVSYAPSAFRIGVVLAIVTGLILLAAVLWSLRRSRHDRPARDRALAPGAGSSD